MHSASSSPSTIIIGQHHTTAATFRHALFADKRNLAVLGAPVLLGGFGVDAGSTALLAQVIPPTVEVVPGNRDALWSARNGYFFKPAAGFGSRGSYRGDKLTRRTWE